MRESNQYIKDRILEGRILILFMQRILVIDYFSLKYIMNLGMH